MNSEQLDFVIKDLHSRGILLDDLKDEIIDHVCSSVDEKMRCGQRFIEAYNEVITSFGSTEGLQETQKETVMLQNYFTVAFRNLKKQRFYTLINITGLAVGVASCLVIMLYVINEFSYDRHFTNYDRVYRLHAEIKFGDNHLRMAVTPAPLSETLQKDFPEVEAAARFWNTGTTIFRRTEDSFKEPYTVFADSSLFTVLDIPFVAGDPKTALKEPNTMVISKKTADKYFPGEQALGQTLTSNSGKS
ncbi:MAG: ABC transporter permease [Bacteroidota bacterium]